MDKTEALANTVNEQREAEEAFKLHEGILVAIAKGREALWDLAEALFLFEEAQGWLKLGLDTRNAYLAQPEVTITSSTYKRLVYTWRDLVAIRKVDAGDLRQLDQSKVDIVRKAIVANTVTVEQALADAGALAASDLREQYYGRPDERNAANNPPDSSGQDLPEVLPDEDEPTRADEIDDLEDGVEEEDVIEAEANEPPELGGRGVAQPGAVEVEPAPAYEFPGWVTRSAVQALLNEARHGVDNGASFPKVGRKPLQVAVELAAAWLKTNPE